MAGEALPGGEGGRAVGGTLAVTTAVLNETERAARSCHPVEDQPVNLTQSCTHQERGVTVNVRCRRGLARQRSVVRTALDPEPFTLQPNTEIPRDLAAVLFVEPIGFDHRNQLHRPAGR